MLNLARLSSAAFQSADRILNYNNAFYITQQGALANFLTDYGLARLDIELIREKSVDGYLLLYQAADPDIIGVNSLTAQKLASDLYRPRTT